MGESLGLQVIAEGIETLEQANAVAALGCNEGQGYLYGRPVDGQTFGMDHAGRRDAFLSNTEDSRGEYAA
jgi:EAL domain-containing protein (putative c-di-GMP-specific phosphodiesterase class I)